MPHIMHVVSQFVTTSNHHIFSPLFECRTSYLLLALLIQLPPHTFRNAVLSYLALVLGIACLASLSSTLSYLINLSPL